MLVHVVFAWADVLEEDPTPHLWHATLPEATPVSAVCRQFLREDVAVEAGEAADGPWSLVRLADYARTEQQVTHLLLLTDAVTAVFDPDDWVGGQYPAKGAMEPTLADVMRVRRRPLKGVRS